MVALKTHRISTDEETLYHTTEITVGNKAIKTPIRAIEPKLITANLDLHSSIKGVNEIYKVLNESKINLITSDTSKQTQFNKDLVRLANKTAAQEITLFFAEYETINNSFPKEITLEYLSDVCHGNSDIIIPPIISKIDKKSAYPYDEYKRFLNNKPVGGIIPFIPYAYMRDLANFYLDLGINFFCFDFEGKNPLVLKDNVRTFFRAITQEESLSNCSFYALNANPGKFGDIASAKDILSFGFGFDILGSNHKRRAIPASVAKQIREPKVRLFNKQAYSYRNCREHEVVNIYSPDSSIPVDSLKDENKYYRFKKAYNMEQQGFESLQLRQIIGEEKLLAYLNTKAQVKDSDKKQIKEFGDKTKFIGKTL
ncbi:MAG: hypothetical protein ACTSP5_09785 [Candidatus Heimdallarchaeota archaeon]